MTQTRLRGNAWLPSVMQWLSCLGDVTIDFVIFHINFIIVGGSLVSGSNATSETSFMQFVGSSCWLFLGDWW